MFWLFACLLAAMVCRRCRWFVLARCAANERFIASLAGCLLVYLFAPPRAVCRLIYVFIWMSVQAFIARQGGEWAMCWQKFCQRHLVTVAAGVCHCHGAVAYLLFVVVVVVSLLMVANYKMAISLMKFALFIFVYIKFCWFVDLLLVFADVIVVVLVFNFCCWFFITKAFFMFTVLLVLLLFLPLLLLFSFCCCHCCCSCGDCVAEFYDYFLRCSFLPNHSLLSAQGIDCKQHRFVVAVALWLYVAYATIC